MVKKKNSFLLNFEGLDLKPILNNIKIPHGGHVEQCKGRELKKKNYIVQKFTL